MKAIRQYLSPESINDELEMSSVNTLNAFLDNMVSVLIFDTFQHMAIKLCHQVSLSKQKIHSI